MRPRILVVDDEEGIRKTIVEHLKLRLDADVVMLSNGADAIREIDQGRYDVLVQDIQMQGMDGITVLRHARRHHPGLIVFVISKFDDEVKIREIESLGGVYLSKPFTLNTITALIKRHFDLKGHSQPYS